MNQKKSGGLLPLKSDFVFHKIFGDTEHGEPLRALIESLNCLPAAGLDMFSIINPHFVPDDPEGKQGILDVLARTLSGDYIHIEVQLLSLPEFKKRITFYSSGNLIRQIASGDDYDKIGRVISIAIVNWNLTADDGLYHKVFRLRELTTGEEFSDVLEIHTLELKKLPSTGDDPLYNWMRMIASEDKEELEMLATKSPEMRHVYVRLAELSKDENARMIYESREKMRRDWASRMKGARAEGVAEGMAAGIVKMGRSFGLSDDELINRLISEGYSRDEAETAVAGE